MLKPLLNTKKTYQTAIIINMASLVFAILGLIGWFGNIIAAQELPFWGAPSSELPLGDLRGIAVDSEGRIYCGLQSYERIQVYDASGSFIRGWFVKANGGSFRIRLNSDDQLEVATARNDMFYIFDHNGLIIDQKSNVDHFFDEFGEEGERIYSDNKMGTLYSIRGGLLFPHIVKKDLLGNETTVVSTVWYKWLVMKPLPAWLFIAIAALLQIVKNRVAGSHVFERM